MVVNAEWILTKNRIIEKVKKLLEDIQEKMLQSDSALHPDSNKIPPKISKGENYKGLPYLILDYPRIFEKENTFAIRTMFWWGNFFSITLHLAGSYKKNAIEKIGAAYESLKSNEFFYCTNENEWEHHFDNTNYVSLHDTSAEEFKKMLEEKPFIKIARKISLHQWNDAGEILLTDFKLIAAMISYRGGEKDL